MTGREEILKIEWSTWTGVLGQEVNGVWPKYTQVNDINATHASFQHDVIVTGDDFGLVKLFRFPSIKKGGCGHWVGNALIKCLFCRCKIQEIHRTLGSCDQCAVST